MKSIIFRATETEWQANGNNVLRILTEQNECQWGYTSHINTYNHGKLFHTSTSTWLRFIEWNFIHQLNLLSSCSHIVLLVSLSYFNVVEYFLFILTFIFFFNEKCQIFISEISKEMSDVFPFFSLSSCSFIFLMRINICVFYWRWNWCALVDLKCREFD